MSEIPGWMTAAELHWLRETAARADSFVEVGCWKGRSTQAVLERCPGPVYAVDHWQGSAAERKGPHAEAVTGDVFAEFLTNVGHYQNLRVRRGNSIEIAPMLPLADVVFIDGGHEYHEVLADINAWAPRTLRIIAGHDYHLPGVKRAVDESFGEHVRTAAESIWWVPNPIARNVMVATPCYGGMASVRYMHSLMRARDFMTRRGIGCEPEWIEGESLVPRARIALLAKFLNDPDYTHLMFVDADLRWEPRAILDLIRWDKEFICGVYPKKGYTDDFNLKWPMNFEAGCHDNLPFDSETGCFEIKDAPNGFLMIRRDAAVKLVQSYPQTRCMIGEGGWDADCNRNTYAVFDCPVDSDGMYLSEDFALCRRWQAIGGTVWMDPHVVLGHTGPHEFRGKIFDSILCTEEVPKEA